MASSKSIALGQQWPPAGLTRRETEVVLLVGAGLSNKEIARELGLSDGTVKLHVHSIFQKTGIRNRSELVVLMATRSSVAYDTNTLPDYEARSRDVRQKIEYLRALWLAAQARPRSLSVVRPISHARQRARVWGHQENDN